MRLADPRSRLPSADLPGDEEPEGTGQRGRKTSNWRVLVCNCVLTQNGQLLVLLMTAWAMEGEAWEGAHELVGALLDIDEKF